MVDRSGKRIAAIGEQADYFMPRLSPDGRKLAVERHNDRGFGDLEIIDLARDASTRFTFKPTKHNAAATWSPTGDRVAYHSQQGPGPSGMFVKAASGSTEERLLLDEGSPTDWTAGDVIVFERRGNNRFGMDLWQMALNGKAEPSPVLNTRALEAQGRVSPNGRWLAYVSDESGAREIYVTQFPAAGGKWQLSTAGGEAPVWRRDGAELFFVSGDGTLMAVPVQTERVFEHGRPVPLFKWSVRRATNTFWFYDAMPDGKQFVGVVPLGERPAAELNVIVNWQ